MNDELKKLQETIKLQIADMDIDLLDMDPEEIKKVLNEISEKLYELE